MITRLHYEPLKASHLDELSPVLRSAEVYAHIEDSVPPLDEFKLSLIRAIAGPGSNSSDQTWLNYLVRDAHTSEMLGRLEATVHDSIAEVAFLFSPAHWGKGYAHEALVWLHTEVSQCSNISGFWATTVPANLRCQALLLRSGYRQVPEASTPLFSYEPGDLVFNLQSAA
jgi:RimJ/RimL family protein N-acetyltransferase